MVGDHINRSSGTFKIMTPFFKSLKDGQEFFIMSGVIEFGGKSTGVECHRVDFTIGECNGENRGDTLTLGLN